MSEWQRIDGVYSSYPVGTRARESWSGFEWIKTERGWKAVGGDTFPRPGGADQIRFPDSASGGTDGTR